MLFIIFWMKVAGAVHCNKWKQNFPKAERNSGSGIFFSRSIMKYEYMTITMQQMLRQCCFYNWHWYQ